MGLIQLYATERHLKKTGSKKIKGVIYTTKFDCGLSSSNIPRSTCPMQQIVSDSPPELLTPILQWHCISADSSQVPVDAAEQQLQQQESSSKQDCRAVLLDSIRGKLKTPASIKLHEASQATVADVSEPDTPQQHEQNPFSLSCVRLRRWSGIDSHGSTAGSYVSTVPDPTDVDYRWSLARVATPSCLSSSTASGSIQTQEHIAQDEQLATLLSVYERDGEEDVPPVSRWWHAIGGLFEKATAWTADKAAVARCHIHYAFHQRKVDLQTQRAVSSQLPCYLATSDRLCVLSRKRRFSRFVRTGTA